MHRNRIAGAVMNLTKKSDVKNHLSSRHRRGIHLTPRASLPDATGFSGEQSDRADPVSGYVTEQWLPEPGIAVPVVPPIVSEPDLRPVAAPVISKSERR